jgi:uncharacterized protein YecE (DUF72 family)
MSHTLRIGTSGWSYDDWVGPFYPEGTRKRDYLEAYTKHFDVVEVDSTFYRTPALRMVQGWADRTPAGFAFALKTPRTITHDKVLLDCEEEMDALLPALEPLGDKLKCLLLQFGYFNRKAFSSSTPFFERLEAFLANYASQVPLACEIRNKNWLTEDYFELLRAHNVAATLVEHAWLPPINELIDQHDVVTAPFSYVRLIGDRKGIEEATTTWNKTVVDRSRDLTRIAKALDQLADHAEVLVFINNHYAGHAPDTCRALRR